MQLILVIHIAKYGSAQGNCSNKIRAVFAGGTECNSSLDYTQYPIDITMQQQEMV